MGSPEQWAAARQLAGRPAETWARIPRLPQHVTSEDLFWPAEVSDTGRVRTVDRVLSDGRDCAGRMLATQPSNRPVCAHTPNPCGCPKYRLVKIRENGRTWTATVHSIMLAAFDKPRPDGMVSRHLDDNPEHNWWPENLAYGTPPENEADKRRNGKEQPCAAPSGKKSNPPSRSHVPSPPRKPSRRVSRWRSWLPLGSRRA